MTPNEAARTTERIRAQVAFLTAQLYDELRKLEELIEQEIAHGTD